MQELKLNSRIFVSFVTANNSEKRPSNTGNVSCNLSGNHVALQDVVCSAYYHLRAQQIFMLQKVKTTSTFAHERLLREKVV